MGEGELRDSREKEERGIADDGDDDEGRQVGGVGQRVKAFGLAPTRFSASPDCRFSSVASISRVQWPLLIISTSTSSSSYPRIWTNTTCITSVSSARVSSPLRHPCCIGPSNTTPSSVLGSVSSYNLAYPGCCKRPCFPCFAFLQHASAFDTIMSHPALATHIRHIRMFRSRSLENRLPTYRPVHRNNPTSAIRGTGSDLSCGP